MGSLLHDISLIHNKDEVRITDGRQTVGNDEAGPSFHQAIHCFLNHNLSSGIHGAGGFIQNKDLRIRQNRPRYGKQLLLPLGYITGLLVEHHLVSVGKGGDEVVHMGGLCCLDYLLIGCVQLAVTDIIHDGSVKQPGILENHSKHPAQITAVKILNIMAVDQNLAVVDIIEAHQQLDHSSLAGASGSDNGNFLPLGNLCAEIINNSFFRLIAEMHMIKLNITVQSFNRNRIFCGLCLFLHRKEFKYPFCGGSSRLEHVGYLHELVDGLRELADILEEGLNLSYFNLTVDCQIASQYCNTYITHVADKLHDWHH